MTRAKILSACAAGVLVLLVVSGVRPYDRATWLMEVAPVLMAGMVMLVTYRRFPLTPFLYTLILAHMLVLIVGGAYTYARVPFGFWMQNLLALERNPYDKLGHFMQGFVPALVAREILVRGAHVAGRKMLVFLCLCVALAISAAYELIEWGAALALGAGADDFLGTQGDPWDTQSDMFFALIGALSSLALFSRFHDRQIGRVAPTH